MQDMPPQVDLGRMRAEFLGTVGHDLRTSLAAITGRVVTLLDGSLELDMSEMRQTYRIGEEPAHCKHDLFSDLMDVTHIENGSRGVAPGQGEVAALADRARIVVLNGGAESNVYIDLPPVLADGRRHRSDPVRPHHQRGPLAVSALDHLGGGRT